VLHNLIVTPAIPMTARTSLPSYTASGQG
jgi:hypothetical protein